MNILMKISSFLLLNIFLINPCFSEEKENSLYEANLSFLNTTLFHSSNLLKIRKYLREKNDYTAIDDLIDYALLYDISIYTDKKNFSSQYKNKTVLGLYRKNIKLVMQEFCAYPPKYIDSYTRSYNVIKSDCKKENCVEC